MSSGIVSRDISPPALARAASGNDPGLFVAIALFAAVMIVEAVVIAIAINAGVELGSLYVTPT